MKQNVDLVDLLFVFTVPKGTPQNVTAVPETVSSIRVSWDPVPEGQRNGNISQYKVWVKEPNGDLIRDVTVGADNFTVVIDSLFMYVTYVFQVQAFTNQGGGNKSLPAFYQTTKQTGMATKDCLRPL